jgi:hypothetical protein
MRAITVKQPWASLIMHCGKDVENRSWSTSFRGRVAIHSSKKTDAYKWLSANVIAQKEDESIPLDLPNGCVLGTVEIYDCVKSCKSPWFMGEYGFLLRDPKILNTPIPCKGKLGFWQLPDDIAEQIEKEIGG